MREQQTVSRRPVRYGSTNQTIGMVSPTSGIVLLGNIATYKRTKNTGLHSPDLNNPTTHICLIIVYPSESHLSAQMVFYKLS